MFSLPLCFHLLCLILNLVLPTSSSSLYYNDNSSSNQSFCHKDEHSALLTLKRSFAFPQPPYPLRSWKNGTDCCEWEGIKCHPLSHHVIVLDLFNNSIVGTIHSNSTLFQLRHLQVIDLSWNNFSSSSISPNFGHFHFLKHLDLSYSGFSGRVPPEIAQLSQLTHLDLSLNYLKFPNSNMIINNLTNLRVLNLSSVNLDSQSLQSIANLSSLESIELSSCSLRGELPASILNLPHLQSLDLSDNDLNFPSSSSSSFNRSWSSPLEKLDLSSTKFSSNIPSFLSQLPHLKELYLSNCSLRGNIPVWVWNIPQSIDLSYNELVGSLPSVMNTSKLINLTGLDLGSNWLVGEVPSWLFSLESLETIDLSYNCLSGSISLYHDVISNFPNLKYVSLSNSGLSVTTSTNVPDDSTSLSNLPNSLEILSLSNTSIAGEFPKWLQQLVREFILILDISHNMLTGRLPIISSPYILYFNASSNKFTGPIDSSICTWTSLEVLDLSDNSLSGHFPHCLGYNNIPNWSDLKYLDLSNNWLEGQFPQYLAQCTALEIINIKGNNFTGEFPISLHTLPKIQVLDLRSNSFHGHITNVNEEHPFSTLQILDISNNKFSGKIPMAYIKNFRAMMRPSKNLGSPQYLTYGTDKYYSIVLTVKGVELHYEKIITTLSLIDLSNNAFEGEIPECVGQLVAIRGLNLSHNHLTGHIPPSIGKLSLLESLDLSSNMLTGQIPQQIVSLTSLEAFNVSNNQIMGRIPTGNNINTFQADSYKGNPELCGQPLHECGSSRTPAADNTGVIQDGSKEDGSTLSMWDIVMMGFGSGVVVGLAWGYCMFTVGRPLWFVELPNKMAMVLAVYCDGAFGRRAARIRTRN